MTTVEFILSVTALHETGFTALAIYLTVLSGHMVVAYSVGAYLTKSQLIFINSIFLVFSIMLSFASYAYFSSAYQLGLEYRPETSPRSEGIMLVLFLIAQFIAIMGSLKFMFDIRKKRGANIEESDT